MSKIRELNKKIEETVVNAYQKMEDTVTGTYQKVEDKFVGAFLADEGETVEQAKARLTGKEDAR